MNSEDIYVIGGEEIYREFLPYCDVAHVTKIDHEYLADAASSRTLTGNRTGWSRQTVRNRRILTWSIRSFAMSAGPKN